jgi:hypothetical protein
MGEKSPLIKKLSDSAESVISHLNILFLIKQISDRKNKAFLKL